ncbi:SPIN family peroxidase inhibitor [Macrococcus armenti]|uniref:SPIN family peroxidase inhibitor n=1 Tax=Macrococcus armenti TaxID=2875764 RepID=UPI001CCFB40E|nr:SPIN family peroxidase inhibitor [Macrococcus armenti]UBH13104.1 SPIN family peroxidase inhibitor [Macrococcus armenti]
MKFKSIAIVALTAGILFSGTLSINEAHASTIHQNDIALHDDSKLLEHELTYVDVLVNPKTDIATKNVFKKYFANLGLYIISDIVKKAKMDGLNVTKYEKFIK